MSQNATGGGPPVTEGWRCVSVPSSSLQVCRRMKPSMALCVLLRAHCLNLSPPAVLIFLFIFAGFVFCSWFDNARSLILTTIWGNWNRQADLCWQATEVDVCWGFDYDQAEESEVVTRDGTVQQPANKQECLGKRHDKTKDKQPVWKGLRAAGPSQHGKFQLESLEHDAVFSLCMLGHVSWWTRTALAPL